MAEHRHDISWVGQKPNVMNLKARLSKAVILLIWRQHSKCPLAFKAGELGEFGPGQMVRSLIRWFQCRCGQSAGTGSYPPGYHLVEVTHRVD